MTGSHTTFYMDEWVRPNEAVDTSNLSQGDGVKLRNGFGEIFWVKVEGIFDDEYLFGKVDIVLFKASDVRAISNHQTRQAQLAHVVQIIKLFEIEMGRRPTVKELDLLSTRSPFVQ